MPGHLRLCKSTTLLLMLAHNGELGLCRALVDRWLPLTRLIRVGGGTLQRPRLQIRPANQSLSVSNSRFMLNNWKSKKLGIQYFQCGHTQTGAITDQRVVCIWSCFSLQCFCNLRVCKLEDPLIRRRKPWVSVWAALWWQSPSGCNLGSSAISNWISRRTKNQGTNKFSVDSLYVFHRKMI